MREVTTPSGAEKFSFEPGRVIFHGNGLLVYDKPAGLPVHRGTGHPVGLAEILETWVAAEPARGLEAGWTTAPLHRLDLEASGVVLFGLARETARAIQAAFAAGQVQKRYLAVVSGPMPEEGAIEGLVRSRLRGVYRNLPSSLDYRRLAGDERLSLVEVVPRGGRTHQIRSLFAEIGRPLAGDLRYGRPKPARQFLLKFNVAHLVLHALEVSIPAGVLGSALTLKAPLPEELRRLAAAKGWQVPETP
jgi:23S rRNA-/tRNA-specific pseudouridylate synthase